MKKILIIYSLAIALMTVSMGYSKTIDSSYEVGTWPGFRKAAITYTFDDGNSNQFAIALPMFDEFGFKMTLFTVTGWVKENWPVLKDAAYNGHEVASHTISHPSLNSINIEKQETELKQSQEAIDANIPKSKCMTIAYPNCRPGDVTLCQKYYIAARHCQGQIEKSTPKDFMNISSIICGSMGSLRNIDNFKEKFEQTASSNGWCVLLFHGIDNDGGYSPIPSAELKATLEYLKENKDTYWVETFLNTVKYIRERDDVSVKELYRRGNSITIQVTDTLDNEIYNYPVTIRRQLPTGWLSAKASQNNKAIDTKIVEVNSVKYIMLDAVPDGGDIVVSNAG
ncbi:MAG: polysaccharide deacetylase family protein [Sedimentisphaerales bacterium]|nr:polysaccharide deacetylase family protein [Sedimentisphaerales bacterium]